ncbi:unnamed protein product [Rotaria sp. Silwood1]|nr:unnamed protein product [Rotaria sp. Silwood1]CAF3585143.1 unnamed protein product [Rotaria sp. Silwood1]CAF3706914.1 unnamed protein product [Rotaria sp. Silwood1]CAF4626121.1 unnamed protein product [Rotaria sp. Silwood1]CAF4734437.1 unnamed protein product [Rotaria sp. Silwood1]
MFTDNWMILAYVMIFSSIILCGLLPMILRLYNARQYFYHYNLECSNSNEFIILQSNNSNKQLNKYNQINQNFQRINSFEQPLIYTQIPFIDDDASI